ncbi:MAG: ABC transporter permease subunit, partial [Firmicutes bacterium]|nr:ABC transporter permease subunit [Bacillota bacterium]
MLNFVARRLAQLVLVVLGVSTVVFLVLRLTGDPVALMLPVEATAQEVAAMRKALGFDAPLYVQYARFLLDLLHGRLGDSLRYGQPALGLVLERLPATLELAGSAQGFALLLAIPVGTLSATRRDSIFDNAGSLLALIGQAMPVFWLGMILIVAFSVQRYWLPAFGRGGIEHLILPAITLGMHGAAMTSRLLRSAMLERLPATLELAGSAQGFALLLAIPVGTLSATRRDSIFDNAGS